MLRRLELLVPPLVVFAAFVAVAVAAPALVPRASLPFPGQRALAVVLFLGGFVLVAAGFLEFRRVGTSVNPLDPGRATSVVTSGIYRATRNPMYAGMAFSLLGVATWRPSLVGYATVPMFCAYITRFQIQPEERALSARFGEEYAEYRERVRRWI